MARWKSTSIITFSYGLLMFALHTWKILERGKSSSSPFLQESIREHRRQVEQLAALRKEDEELQKRRQVMRQRRQQLQELRG